MIFDLDGTLWDATDSIALAWMDVLNSWNLKVDIDKNDIRAVAGRPYLECLKIVCPNAANVNEFDKLLIDLEKSEKRYMNEIGGSIYEGVIEGLSYLSKKNNLYLVSNCNEWYLEAFFSQTGLRELFEFSLCHGTNGLSKYENLLKLKHDYNQNCRYYIGDTIGDKISSEDAGLIYVHANYGYLGTELITDLKFDNFSEICAYLTSSKHG